MNATRAKKPEVSESTPPLPQSTPQSVGYGAPDHSFTLQAIMEMQKSVGRIEANLAVLQSSVDSTKTKVDNLVELKNKIIGAMVAISVISTVLISGLTFLFNKASNYLTWKSDAPAVAPAALPPQIQPPVAQPAPAAKKP